MTSVASAPTHAMCAASYAPSPFNFTDILITYVQYFALYCTACGLLQRFAELLKRDERFELVNQAMGLICYLLPREGILSPDFDF